MKYRHELKIILIAAIFLISISGCSFFNNGEQTNSTENKLNQGKNISEEAADLKGNVLSISGNEITIAKMSVKGSGSVTAPKKGSKINPKDTERIKITESTKIMVRNSYGEGGNGKGGRHEDKTGGKNDIKVDSFVEIWTEKSEENTAKTVRISIFNK